MEACTPKTRQKATSACRRQIFYRIITLSPTIADTSQKKKAIGLNLQCHPKEANEGWTQVLCQQSVESR